MGVFVLPHGSHLFRGGPVTQMTQHLGCGPAHPAAELGGSLVRREPPGGKPRAQPRARDAQAAGPDDAMATPSPAAPAKGSIRGFLSQEPGSVPSHLAFLFFFSLGQFVLAPSAPGRVPANVTCFLTPSHLNKNEEHQRTRRELLSPA